MDNITKYNLKTGAVAAGILLLLLCLFSYVSAPISDGFLEALNPLPGLMGMVFTLNYLGLPVWLSVVILILLLALIWLALFWASRLVIK